MNDKLLAAKEQTDDFYADLMKAKYKFREEIDKGRYSTEYCVLNFAPLTLSTEISAKLLQSFPNILAQEIEGTTTQGHTDYYAQYIILSITKRLLVLVQKETKVSPAEIQAISQVLQFLESIRSTLGA